MNVTTIILITTTVTYPNRLKLFSTLHVAFYLSYSYVSLQPTPYCRRTPTHSENYQSSIYVKLKKSSLKKRTKISSSRQVRIYIKSRASIYVFNLPKHFALSVRTIRTPQLSQILNRLSIGLGHFFCVFVHLFFEAVKNSIKSMIYTVK